MAVHLALWHRLRGARAGSGATPIQAAEALGWPIADYLLVEAAADGVDDGRLSALLDRYGIADEDIGALSIPDDPQSQEVRVLSAYEKVASTVCAFEPFVVPGLLQTPRYAQVALGLYATSGTLGPLVEARLARQGILDRDDAPEMRFLLDESALHRWDGAAGDGPEIMREQIDRLRRVAQNPRVDLRIVPYQAGLHAGVKGPFVTLKFAEADAADLLYLEDAKGDVVRVGADEVRPYIDRFEELAGISVPAGAILD